MQGSMTNKGASKFHRITCITKCCSKVAIKRDPEIFAGVLVKGAGERFLIRV